VRLSAAYAAETADPTQSVRVDAEVEQNSSRQGLTRSRRNDPDARR